MGETMLLDRLAHASGLSPVVARRVMMRALMRAGVREPEKADAAEVRLALPVVREVLQLFLDDETGAAVQRLQAIVDEA